MQKTYKAIEQTLVESFTPETDSDIFDLLHYYVGQGKYETALRTVALLHQEADRLFYGAVIHQLSGNISEAKELRAKALSLSSPEARFLAFDKKSSAVRWNEMKALAEGRYDALAKTYGMMNTIPYMNAMQKQQVLEAGLADAKLASQELERISKERKRINSERKYAEMRHLIEEIVPPVHRFLACSFFVMFILYLVVCCFSLFGADKLLGTGLAVFQVLLILCVAAVTVYMYSDCEGDMEELKRWIMGPSRHVETITSLVIANLIDVFKYASSIAFLYSFAYAGITWAGFWWLTLLFILLFFYYLFFIQLIPVFVRRWIDDEFIGAYVGRLVNCLLSCGAIYLIGLPNRAAHENGFETFCSTFYQILEFTLSLVLNN